MHDEDDKSMSLFERTTDAVALHQDRPHAYPMPCLIRATSKPAGALVKGSSEQCAINRYELRFSTNIGLHGQEPRSDLAKQLENA